MKKILVFKWPQEAPILSADDGSIRINYNGLWIDMHHERIEISKEIDDMVFTEPATQYKRKLSTGEF